MDIQSVFLSYIRKYAVKVYPVFIFACVLPPHTCCCEDSRCEEDKKRKEINKVSKI